MYTCSIGKRESGIVAATNANPASCRLINAMEGEGEGEGAVVVEVEIGASKREASVSTVEESGL